MNYLMNYRIFESIINDEFFKNIIKKYKEEYISPYIVYNTYNDKYIEIENISEFDELTASDFDAEGVIGFELILRINDLEENMEEIDLSIKEQDKILNSNPIKVKKIKTEQEISSEKLNEIQKHFGGKYTTWGLDEKGEITNDPNKIVGDKDVKIRISDHSYNPKNSGIFGVDKSYVVSFSNETKGRFVPTNNEEVIDIDLTEKEIIEKIETDIKKMLNTLKND